MITHTEKRVIPYPPELMFDLVADVERYPEFLPFWREAEVIHRGEGVYFTDQAIGIGPIRERFRSRTGYQRPDFIEVTSSATLFRHFDIRWRFLPASDGQCQVDFSLACEARSRLLHRAFDRILAETAYEMVSAFEQRARQVYGAPKRAGEEGGP